MIYLEVGEMFESIVASVVGWLDSIMGPLLAIVGVAGALYCAARAVKFVNAGAAQDREKAKSLLITAIVVSVIVFAVVLALKLLMPGVVEWASSSAAAVSE